MRERMVYKLTKDEEDFLKDFTYKQGNLFGRDKLFYAIRNRFPEQDISRRELWSWMNKQEVFQINRKPTMSRGIVRTMNPGKPGWIQMDNINLESHAYNGYKYIVHAVDLFLKKDYAVPAKSLDVETMKKAIDDFLQQGMKMSYCQTDLGSEWKGDFVDYVKSKGAKHMYSKPNSPWSNGTVESRNYSITRAITMWIKATGNLDWPSMLPTFLKNINSTMTYATKESADKLEADDSLHEGIAERIANEKSRSFKGKSTKVADLKVGDWVRLRDFDKSGLVKRSKVGWWSSEIYVIESIYTPRKTANVTQSFKIKNKETGETMKGLYSLGQLLHIPQDTETLEKAPQRPPAVNEDEVSDDEHLEWELDGIVGHKVVRATRKKPEQIMYRVKYTGWKKLYWIPETDFTNSKRILNDYKRQNGLL
jgi:hypothetical protein